jgi:hypothetical protein
MASPLPPDADNPDISGLLRHITVDIHDLSKRLAKIEALADEFAPLGRQYARLQSVISMRKRGSGNARGVVKDG